VNFTLYIDFGPTFPNCDHLNFLTKYKRLRDSGVAALLDLLMAGESALTRHLCALRLSAPTGQNDVGAMRSMPGAATYSGGQAAANGGHMAEESPAHAILRTMVDVAKDQPDLGIEMLCLDFADLLADSELKAVSPE
jgi:hypothetical protein